MSYFQTLRSNYPWDNPCDAKNKKGEPLFKNQCAIKLSYAMSKTGTSFVGYPSGRKCWVHKNKNHILAAKELADWIDRGAVPQIQKSKDITGEYWRTNQSEIKDTLSFYFRKDIH